jgi:hypothetical protein
MFRIYTNLEAPSQMEEYAVVCDDDKNQGCFAVVMLGIYVDGDSVLRPVNHGYTKEDIESLRFNGRHWKEINALM